MRRVLAATALSLLFAAPCARAADPPMASSPGKDVPAAKLPAAPEARSLAPSALDDDAITRKVTGAIHADPRLAGTDISVNTDHGVVNLTGDVRSREQSVIATARAQGPDGVMRIDNHLSVTPP
jgi:hyperosmotically inducible protein